MSCPNRPIRTGLPAFILAFLIQTAAHAESDTGNWFSVVSILHHEDALARAHDVELSGDLAFVPGKGGSIAIVDVADPTIPKLLWHRRDPEELPDSETVLLFGHHLLLGTRDFHSIDISNPTEPRFLKKISDRENDRIDRINGMVKIGDIVFAANKSGWIDAFDLSDPGSPVFFGALEVKNAHGLSSPHDIDTFDDFIGIVSPNGFGKEATGHFAIFQIRAESGDILPTEKWTLMSSLADSRLAGANRVQISGEYAFIGGSWSPEYREEDDTPMTSVVDLADPNDPQVVAAVPFLDERGPNGLVVAGKIAFPAGGETIEAIDISDPRQPVKIGSGKLPASNIRDHPKRKSDNAHDLVYRDGYLFVSCQSDDSFMILKVVDERIRSLADSR